MVKATLLEVWNGLNRVFLYAMFPVFQMGYWFCAAIYLCILDWPDAWEIWKHVVDQGDKK